MSHGYRVYLGPSTQMMSHFIDRGFPHKENDNPADFALDTLNRINNSSEMENYCSLPMNRQSASDLCNNSDDYEIRSRSKSRRSFAVDFFYVSQRTLRNAIRNLRLLASQIFVAITLGFLTGLLYYKLPQTTDLGVQNRLGCIFFIVVNQIFSTATALEPFIKERALFIHVSLKYKSF